jgi:hypothetical protein
MEIISKHPAELLAYIMLHKIYKCFKGVRIRSQRFQQCKNNPDGFHSINNFQIVAHSLHCWTTSNPMHTRRAAGVCVVPCKPYINSMIIHRRATALTLNAKPHTLQLRDHNKKNLKVTTLVWEDKFPWTENPEGVFLSNVSIIMMMMIIIIIIIATHNLHFRPAVLGLWSARPSQGVHEVTVFCPL